MNTAELKALKKRIARLTERLDLLRSAADRKTATAAEAHDSGSSAEISDVENELRSLQAVWDDAIRRLSYDDDEANCIYLHYVIGWSWKDLAKLSSDCGIIETPNAVMKRCKRYEW